MVTKEFFTEDIAKHKKERIAELRHALGESRKSIERLQTGLRGAADMQRDRIEADLQFAQDEELKLKNELAELERQFGQTRESVDNYGG